MERPIQIAIGIGMAIGGMAVIAAVYYGAIGGTTTGGHDIIPKTLDLISSDKGRTLQVSVALNNQGSVAISSVGAVLRADVKDACSEGSANGAEHCTNDGGLGERVIYFPLYYSQEVVETFGTINIRAVIETPGGNYAATQSLTHNPVGCGRAADTAPAFIDPAAGFADIGEALSYVTDKMPDVTHDGNYPAYAAGQNTVNKESLICARDLGIFSGSQLTLTVVMEATSGETIERILPVTVK